MYKRISPKCKNASYSASKKGKWFCPICFKDLTQITDVRNQDKKTGGDTNA